MADIGEIGAAIGIALLWSAAATAAAEHAANKRQWPNWIVAVAFAATLFGGGLCLAEIALSSGFHFQDRTDAT